jgi:eukaryotic-like serine/threonine-protein kinase
LREWLGEALQTAVGVSSKLAIRMSACDGAVAAEPQPARRSGFPVGKYRLEHVLGRGGMGIVARAHHLTLDQPVAIKLLLPGTLENEDIVQRFRREARAMVQLKSEHVSKVFDVGTLENGAPYMVMEYLEGKDLGRCLLDEKRLEPGFAVDLMLQGCEALAEAHAAGIVHRDAQGA